MIIQLGHVLLLLMQVVKVLFLQYFLSVNINDSHKLDFLSGD